MSWSQPVIIDDSASWVYLADLGDGYTLATYHKDNGFSGVLLRPQRSQLSVVGSPVQILQDPGGWTVIKVALTSVGDNQAILAVVYSNGAAQRTLLQLLDSTVDGLIFDQGIGGNAPVNTANDWCAIASVGPTIIVFHSMQLSISQPNTTLTYETYIAVDETIQGEQTGVTTLQVYANDPIHLVQSGDSQVMLLHTPKDGSTTDKTRTYRTHFQLDQFSRITALDTRALNFAYLADVVPSWSGTYAVVLSELPVNDTDIRLYQADAVAIQDQQSTDFVTGDEIFNYIVILDINNANTTTSYALPNTDSRFPFLTPTPRADLANVGYSRSANGVGCFLMCGDWQGEFGEDIPGYPENTLVGFTYSDDTQLSSGAAAQRELRIHQRQVPRP